MRTIGLLGGMSWESSAQYYRIINEETRRRLGGNHSARSIMLSLDFAEVAELQHSGNWDALRALLVSASLQLVDGGAQVLVLCTNTMHCVAEALAAAVPIPLLHIADVTGEKLISQNIRKVGLLGTRFTMEQPFYRDRLEKIFGLEVVVPNTLKRQSIHNIIYEELVRGDIRPASRTVYREVIADLVQAGAEGIILGCTEIMLLVDQSDSPVPVFDTTSLHATAAVEWALS